MNAFKIKAGTRIEITRFSLADIASCPKQAPP